MHALLVVAAVTAFAPEDVVDPRPAHHVVDTTGTLTDVDIADIDDSAKKSAPFGELMVVVVDTVSGAVPREFTTRLFNRLRLDPTPRNQGVLVLVALSDHKAEIVVGDGFTGITAVTDVIMRDVIVARMKEGSPRGAITGAAWAVMHRVFVDRDTASVVTSNIRRAVDPESPVTWGGGVALLLGGGLGTRSVLRYRKRSCAKCKTKMTRLDEAADDKHLNASEKTEESLGSVDHDVWFCGRCGHVQKIGWSAIFSSYSRCGSCRTRAHKTTTTTLVSPTQYSEGSAQVDEHCKHCGKRNSYTKTLARLPPPDTSSSSSSSSSGGGGGYSSGGGSSGSW